METENKANVYSEYSGPPQEVFDKINNLPDNKLGNTAKNSALQAAMMFLRGE